MSISHKFLYHVFDLLHILFKKFYIFKYVIWGSSMKNNKSIITIFIILTLYLLGFFVILPLRSYFVGKSFFTSKKIYEEIWNIVLPSDFEEIYTISSPTSFHGDGERYTIYYAKDIDKNYIRNFQNIKNPDIEYFVKSIVDKLEVENKNKPDFSQAYLWVKYEKVEQKDMLVILYFNENQTFYFIQSIF